MKTLEDYFREAPAIDHAIRHFVRADGGIEFYIHPANTSGVTMDFVVKGNELTLRFVSGLNQAAADGVVSEHAEERNT